MVSKILKKIKLILNDEKRAQPFLIGVVVALSFLTFLICLAIMSWLRTAQ